MPLYSRKLHPFSALHKEIRLVRVLQNDRNVVCCQLYHTELNDSYWSLSYAWGDPAKTSPIVVNGELVNVTINLEAALREIRRSNYQASFWIDALSIDQNDDYEKQHQVSNMGQIYQSADQILVWLGPGDDDAKISCELLHRLGLFAVENGVRDLRSKYAADNGNLDKFAQQLCDRFLVPRYDEFKSLGHFFSRPWWSRVWVIQEVALAKTAVLAAGQHTVRWGLVIASLAALTLFRASLYLDASYKLSPGQDIFEPTAPVNLVNHHLYICTSWPKPWVDLDLLNIFRIINQPPAIGYPKTLQCSDPRDFIYSFFAIMDQQDRSAITLRYDADWTSRMLYSQVTVICLQRHGPVVLLEYACHDHRENALNIPSWAMDWSRLRQRVRDDTGHLSPDSFKFSTELSRYSAQGSSIFTTNSFRFHANEAILSVKGLIFDAVEHRPAYLSPVLWKSIDDLHEYLNNWYNVTKGYSVTSFVEAVTRFLIWQYNFENDEVSNRVKDSWTERFHQMMDPVASKISGRFQFYLSTFENERLGVPFGARSGKLGLATETMIKGDVLCIFEGASVPIILRKVKGAQYSIIGVAFVDGAMLGELITPTTKFEWIDLV